MGKEKKDEEKKFEEEKTFETKIEENDSLEEETIKEEFENLEEELSDEPEKKESEDIQEEIVVGIKEETEEEKKIEEEKEDSSDCEFEEKEKSWLDKVKEFELDTKIGLVLAIIIALAALINIQWINYTWWLMILLSGFAIRNLYKQKVELEEEKPFEARVSNIAFLALIVILIIRDLMITSRISEFMDIFKS
ncbi:MAG: hypothetical protein CR982_05835 [Candidatus Cloacimonadota bacterium]|nr:MAG: hypothetical protein CR982_05835 [Candidatus Cloacimonadota bacterium]PIE81644.1 MAG: hypothetical protein CSA15_00540 [Candidatus Delongbacteria bacterium]